MAPPVVAGHDLTKRYGEGDAAVNALRGVSLEIQPGSFTAIMGPSGSGKSTLMHLLAGLDRPTSGTVDDRRHRDRQARRHRPHAPAPRQDRLRLPGLQPRAGAHGARRTSGCRSTLAGRGDDDGRVERLLEAVALADRRTHRPAELSGGQQQRVAVARALASEPAVIFADEPTGNLDSTTSQEILGLLRRAVDEFGQAVVMVTHDATAAAVADRVVFLDDGHIVADEPHLDAEQILDQMKALA